MKDLKFLGIGGACNLKFGGNCAYLKEGNSLMLIDCAEGVADKLVSKNILSREIKDFLIVITHTHADHIAGIGTLLWYCNFRLGFKPRIFCNSESFKKSITNLLDIFGVERDCYVFTQENKAKFLDIDISAIPVTHYPTLECFAIKFKDKTEKVIYSGDTNDIEFIKKQTKDRAVNKIYCEVSLNTLVEHIHYEDLKQIKEKDKFILMHFNKPEDYELIKAENLFKVATIN